VRAVLDTNVLISGLLWKGAPHSLLERVRDGVLTIVISPTLLSELSEVLQRPKFVEIFERASVDVLDVLANVRRVAEIIEPPPLAAPASRDIDDDAVLALAIAGQVDLIVSGDSDLRALGSYSGIPILGPADAMRMLASAAGLDSAR
jgi:putative PIN family toxin of toxin-antitoxin system